MGCAKIVNAQSADKWSDDTAELRKSHRPKVRSLHFRLCNIVYKKIHHRKQQNLPNRKHDNDESKHAETL